MNGKVVLVCTDQLRTWRHLTPPLAGAGNHLVHAQSTERAVDLLSSGAVDVALIEWPSGVELDPVLEAAEERAPLVALVTGRGIRALEELVCRRGVLHLCAARPEQEVSAARKVDPDELVVTCEKLLRRDFFGLDKYLAAFGVERFSRVVEHADERDEVVAKLAGAVRALGAGRRLVESVSLVGDELLTNAVYNAPRDADGRPRYAHVSRRHKVALEPAEQVRLEYGSDGRVFGLAVTDNFGALAPEQLRICVERCLARQDPIEHKPGGAGIGLYASLCHADHLVLNVEAGVRTEVIALWYLARRNGGRGAGVASLHVFQRGQQIVWPRARDTIRVAAAEPSVALSDSVKNQLCEVLIDVDDARVSMSPSQRDTLHDAVVPKPVEVEAMVGMTEPDVAEATEESAALEPVTDSMVMEALSASPEAVDVPAAEPDDFELDVIVVEDLAEEASPAADPSWDPGSHPDSDAMQLYAPLSEEASPAADPSWDPRSQPDSDALQLYPPLADEASPAADPSWDPRSQPDSDALQLGAELVIELSPEESEDLEQAQEVEEVDAAEDAEELQLTRDIDLAADVAEPADVAELPARSAESAEDPSDTARGAVLEHPTSDRDETPLPRPATWFSDEREVSAPFEFDDLETLYDMGILGTALIFPASGPAWLGPLTCLRGAHVPRHGQPVGFDTALARMRESATLADAVEALLTVLLEHWSAAMLLCRAGEMLVPWMAAGDVEGWDELCEMELPLAPGWLTARTLSPGVTLASLDEDPTARRLSDRLSRQRADEGLALSFVLERSVLVVFARRLGSRMAGDILSDYEELQRDLSDLSLRVDRFSRLPIVRRPSAQAEAG